MTERKLEREAEKKNKKITHLIARAVFCQPFFTKTAKCVYVISI